MLDGEPATVIGVMPPAPRIPVLGSRDLWTPLAVDEAAALAEPLWGFRVLGRLRHGVAHEQAKREIERLAARLAVESPATNEGWGVVWQPVRFWVVGHLEAPLLLFFGAGVLVLVIACATVSSLIASRLAVRRRETFPRLAGP